MDGNLIRSIQEEAYHAFHARPNGILNRVVVLELFQSLMDRVHGYRVDLSTSDNILKFDDEQAAAFLSLVREYAYALHIPRDPDHAARLVAAEAVGRRRRSGP